MRGDEVGGLVHWRSGRGEERGRNGLGLGKRGANRERRGVRRGHKRGRLWD